MNIGEYEPRTVEKGVEETTLPVKEGTVYWIVQTGKEEQMDVEKQSEAEILSRLIKLEIALNKIKGDKE